LCLKLVRVRIFVLFVSCPLCRSYWCKQKG